MSRSGSIRQQIFYALGQVGNGIFGGFNNAIIPLWLHHFTGNPFLITYLGNTSTVEGVVIQPLIGRWSDRTTSRLGRRKPFILVGFPVAAFLLVLTPIVARHGGPFVVPLISTIIILFSIATNIGNDPNQALMVDITTDRERPRYNAILTVIGLLAQVGITVLVAAASFKNHGIPAFAFGICAAGMLVSAAILVVLVREPKEAREMAARQDAIPWRDYVREARQSKEAFKLLASVFFFWTGLNALKPWLSYLPIKLTHATTSQGLIIYAVMIVSALIFAYPYSRLALRYGSRKVIIFGTVLLIVSALFGVVIPSYIWFFPLAIVAGCGFSATTVLTYPYLMELIPGGRIGAFTGLQTAFSACAVPLSAVLVGVLIDHFGFRSVFALLALLMVVDVLFLASIDGEAAKKQIAAVEAGEQAAIRMGVVAPASVTP